MLVAGAVLTTSVLALAGCSTNPLSTDKAKPAAATSSHTTQAGQQDFSGHVDVNVRRAAMHVKINRVMRVQADRAQLQRVSLTSDHGPVPGKLAGNGSSWRATGLLRTDTAYILRARAVDNHGVRKDFTRTFRTRKLTLDEQTYPSFSPTDGSTVGIAMPVIVRFDVPVTKRASIQRHLQVQTQPAQKGSWHWISDNEVHWRPKHYWKPGTDVTVRADIRSVPAAKGVYGQLNRKETFHIGRSQITRVNLDTDQLTVHRGGHVIRTIPVSAGQEPEFTTRSGIKVIVDKELSTRMNSETIGINPNSAQGYDLSDVRYAMRLTYSGEFLHAAPWSVASQGHANTSHGCTGMSTANAHWLFDSSLIGDPVVFTGTNKPMTLTNGFGDWNESFRQYKEGSAL
ncbi:MAG: Ig-like domain-containing protein [Marmoricola sp.]